MSDDLETGIFGEEQPAEKPAFQKPEGFGQPDTPEQKALREEAATLGLKFRGRPKAEKMRAMIEAKRYELAHPEALPAPPPAPVVPQGIPRPQEPTEPPMPFPKGQKLYLTEEEWQQEVLKDAKRTAGRLVRVRITCMNPNKKNWTGEIFSVGSAKVGTYKKFIPFGLEEPYHIPEILYNELKERKCAIRNLRKSPDGKEHVEVKMIPEFAIEVLPPLTPAELEDLRRQQAMARGGA